MSREETYCVKEKTFTKNNNPIVKTFKNGNKYVQSTCLISGNKKVVLLNLMENLMENLINKHI